MTVTNATYGSQLRISLSHAHAVLRSSFRFSCGFLSKRDCWQSMFIAQVLVGPSKQLKQINQIEHNIVKNPDWPEANQLAVYKRVVREPRSTREIGNYYF